MNKFVIEGHKAYLLVPKKGKYYKNQRRKSKLRGRAIHEILFSFTETLSAGHKKQVRNPWIVSRTNE
jgi:hypothetical protein